MGIGQINEYSLHAEIKSRYSLADTQYEVEVDGYVVDVVCGEELIEIQTGGFSQIRNKISSLVAHHPVRLVYPLPVEKELIVYDREMKKVLYRRRSPKRGSLVDVFKEIIYIIPVLLDPNFTLEVILTREEELRVKDGCGSYRRRGISIHDRKLTEVVDTHVFRKKEDYLQLLPKEAPPFFTNRDLAQIMKLPQNKVRKMTYCFKHLGLITVCRREGNAQVFTVS